MKTLYFIILSFSISTYAMATSVTCYATKAFQIGAPNMKTNAELHFDLEKNGNLSKLSNVVGHVFVKSPVEDDQSENLGTENSYMGFFHLASLTANQSYHPTKYKGHAQFKDFDAVHTTGVEGGMWGYLTLNVSTQEKKFAGNYVFQAGDHMGGTVAFECSAE